MRQQRSQHPEPPDYDWEPARRPQPRRAPARRPPRRKLRVGRLLVLVAIVVAAACFGARSVRPPAAALARPTATAVTAAPAAAAPVGLTNAFGVNPVNILLLGTDAGLDGGIRTDTMILLLADTDHHRLAAVNVPRDTRVRTAEGKAHKVNAAWQMGGQQAAAQAVANLTGQPVHHVVKCDLANFEKIVNALGGVDLNVEKRMRYTDHAQHLRIDLKPGQQKLDGPHAMQYVRFRKDGLGDLGRIKRQQNFLKAVAKAACSPSNLSRLPKVVRAISSGTETTLSTVQLMRLAQLLTQIDVGRVQALQLPGDAEMIKGVSYFIAADTAPAAVKALLAAPPPATKGAAPALSKSAPTSAPAAPAAPEPLTVTLYNGSDRVGLERVVGRTLAAKGLPCSPAPEATVDQAAHTQVWAVDPAHRPAAQRVAVLLGVQASSNPAPAAYPPAGSAQAGVAQVVVVLGADVRLK